MYVLYTMNWCYPLLTIAFRLEMMYILRSDYRCATKFMNFTIRLEIIHNRFIIHFLLYLLTWNKYQTLLHCAFFMNVTGQWQKENRTNITSTSGREIRRLRSLKQVVSKDVSPPSDFSNNIARLTVDYSWWIWMMSLLYKPRNRHKQHYLLLKVPAVFTTWCVHCGWWSKVFNPFWTAD